MKRPLLFIPVLIFLNTALAQEGPTPAQTLRLARATYEQGRLHEIPTQLNDEVIAKMTKQEKVEAHKILCLTYIYLEEPAKADESMLNILSTDPYFQVNDVVDPAEFVALYKTFRTLPVWRIGGKLGVGACIPNISESATAGNLGEGSKYSSLIGIHFGLAVEKPINTRLTITGELQYSQKRFKFTQIFDREEDIITGETLENTTEGIEQETWLSLPLSVEYKPIKGKSKFNEKFNPYLRGGVAIDYLLGAKITGEQLRDKQPAIQEKSFDIKDLRTPINISVLAGAGVKIRAGGGYIVSEVRFLYGLTKLSSKESAYQNQPITWELNYADPIFTISSLEVSAGYIQNIFNPKKLMRRK